MGLKTEIVKDGEDYILILPDEICQELSLRVGDTLSVNYNEETEELSLRKVDEREEWET